MRYVEELVSVVEMGVKALKEATKVGISYPAGAYLYKRGKPCCSANMILTPDNQRACLAGIGELCAKEQCSEVIISFDMYFIQAITQEEIKAVMEAPSLSSLPKEKRDEFLYTQYVNFKDLRKSCYSKWIYESKGPYLSFITEEFKDGVLSPGALKDMVLGFSTTFIKKKIFQSKTLPKKIDMVKADQYFRKNYLKGLSEVIAAALPKDNYGSDLPKR